jgi:hypothetical protein
MTAPDQGLKDVTRLRNLLHYSNTKMWDKLTGGGDSRFFAKDLKKYPMTYNYVMTELQDYISNTQQIYPKLKHVKGGAILSAPNDRCRLMDIMENFTPTIQPMFWNIHQMKGIYQ